MKNMDEEQVKKIIDERLEYFLKSDKFVFNRLIQILDGRNMQTGRTNGTMIGTASDQKIAFFGNAPVAKQGAIGDPTGGGTAGVDTPCRSTVSAILTVLRNLGFINT